MTAAMVHRTVKVTSQRPAPPPQPVAATPAPHAAPMPVAAHDPAQPLHFPPGPGMEKAYGSPAPQGWSMPPPPIGYVEPTQTAQPQSWPAPPPAAPYPMPTFPPTGAPQAAAAALGWPNGQPIGAAPASFAAPPSVDLLLDTGAAGMGTFGTRFHQVKAENGFLVMVYDNRYEGPGQRWVPPKLDPSQRMVIHVPSLRQSFQVSLHGMHFSVDSYDVYLAVVHQAAPHGQPPQQNGFYQ